MANYSSLFDLFRPLFRAENFLGIDQREIGSARATVMLQYTGMNTSTPPPIETPGQSDEGKPIRRDFILQVILPFVFGILVLTVGVILLWRAGVGTASAWADTSLIFLMIPWLCVGLVPLAVLGALWFGIFKLTAWLPAPLRKVRNYIGLSGRQLRRATDAAVKPMIVTKGVWAVVEAFFKGLGKLIGLNNGESNGRTE